MANTAGGGSGLPGTCSVCEARPGLVIVEVNGVAITREILCSACFARSVREKRASRVTPIGGVPIGPAPAFRR
jgi:hypothetical protein